MKLKQNLNKEKIVKNSKVKYIFVVGGVMSGVGKGITTSSIGLILKERGLKISAIKIDPYLNVDAGTMNPVEHGEVYVLGDGDECDQDMGNYERFLDLKLSRDSYITSGRIFQSVIQKERGLNYGGKCVQVIPHITDDVIERIENVGKRNEIVMIEIGGTVGEYENQLFLEAARLMKNKHKNNVAMLLVSYAPIPKSIGEMKTKPTQHASRLLNESGLQADMLIIRSEERLDEVRKEKMAMFCNVLKENIISAPDVKSIYDVPLNFEIDKVGNKLCEILNLKSGQVKNKEMGKLDAWKKFFDGSNFKKEIKVAVVCKYIDSGDFVLSDAYVSVIESIKYACYAEKVLPKIEMLSSELYEVNSKNNKTGVQSNLAKLKSFDCVVIPGGFGNRGVLGKIQAIKYVRENKIPTLGICYGMQLMVIEYAQNILKIKNANTTEIDSETKNPIVCIMENQKEKIKNNIMGNSMRLGDCESVVKEKTLAYKIYKTNTVTERHRHRYEINPKYYENLNSSDLIISCVSKDEGLAEMVEISDNSKHPYFIGCQFHPEFLSRPMKPHPLFLGLIKAGIAKSK